MDSRDYTYLITQYEGESKMFAQRHIQYPVEDGSVEEFMAAINQQKSKAEPNQPSPYNYLEKRLQERFGSTDKLK